MVEALDAAMAQVLSLPTSFETLPVETFKAAGSDTPVDAVVARGLLSHTECEAIIALCEQNAAGFTFWASGGAAAADGAESDDAGVRDTAEAMLPGEADYSRRTLFSSRERSEPCRGGKTAMENEEQARAFRTAYTIEGLFPKVSALLWERIKQRVPLRTRHFHPDMPDAESLYERDLIGTWEPVSLSSDLLLARYLDGGHFAPHVDGSTIVDLNTRSLYTALIYLNTCDGGGETRVFAGEQCDVLTVDGTTGKICGKSASAMAAEGGSHQCVGSIVPVEGLLALFSYDVLHEGASVHPGHKKYIIRSDVLYRRQPPILTETADVEAFALFQKARVMEASGETDEALRLFRLVRRTSPGVAALYQL